MKTTGISIITFIALLLVLTSCDSKFRKEGSGVVTTSARNLQDFHRMEVDGSYDLFLHESNTNYITITTDDNIMGMVQTFVQDGELHVEMSDDFHNYDYTRMEIHVYGQGYAYIDLNGAVNVTSQDTLHLDAIELRQNGSGVARLEVSTQEFIAAINGSGRIETNGAAERLVYDINGSGKIDGLDLIAQHAEVSITGSGDVYVHAISTLQAEIEGSGDIRYLGAPLITSDIHGSGSISAY